MSRERKRRSSCIVEMVLVNAGIGRNMPKCRRRLSYELNTQSPASKNIDTSIGLAFPALADSISTTTDHTEMTATITAARKSLDRKFDITLTSEPDIEEPTLIDHQVEENTQYSYMPST
ncbi:jg18751 [Pararge aegeria aegeria]|uniref:Jg18751 protein n=1 Tax=Pararge aegeria aegeria TaxID=348720 RepID=A0A8S4R513_9NEOP|nr:jg18751 [Pararge aegeria aegeria]